MKKICYISFATKKDESLLHLHSSAIRRFDSVSDIIYFSDDEISVPSDTYNIKDMSIGDRKGFGNLSKMLTIFATLAGQYETIIYSNPSAIILNKNGFIDALMNEQTLSWYVIDNQSTTPNVSCFGFRGAVVEPLTNALKDAYMDAFNARNCLEVFLYYLTLISHPQQIVIAPGILADQLHANYAVWNPTLYNTPQQLEYVGGFIECGHLSYLQPYAECRLDLYQQIKRAEKFILHHTKNKKS